MSSLQVKNVIIYENMVGVQGGKLEKSRSQESAGEKFQKKEVPYISYRRY